MIETKLHKAKVLVIEDSADTMDLICLTLKHGGAQIETATNGQEGIEKALSTNPDILLLDLEVPEVSGFGVIKFLRKNNYTKPILAVTSHDTLQDRDRVFQAGFNGYITKPFDTTRLLEVINLHLPDKHKH